MKTQILTAFLLFFALFGCHTTPKYADTIVVNAIVWTGDTTQTSLTAVAIVGDRFVAVGTNADLLKWKGSKTEVIDVKGEMLLPGFIDAHLHLIPGGLNLMSLKLDKIVSKDGFIDAIKTYTIERPKGTWIRGGGWDESRWGGELPTKTWIDAVAPDYPVILQRIDVHAALANAMALRLASIDRNTPNPEGGIIVRDAKGEPTGLLKDKAINLLDAVIPPYTAAELDDALKTSLTYIASQGVTSVHNMAGLEPEGSWEAILRAKKSNQLTARICDYRPLSDVRRVAERIKKDGVGDEWLKIGGLKGFIDGSLGSKTASMHQPYLDKHNHKGIYITPKDSLTLWIDEAERSGLQVALHAIGDEAVTFALNTFQANAKRHGARDRRYRIEHAQHIDPQDIGRFAELQVIPSMQPYHLVDDGRWAEKVIGPELIKTSYAYKSLYDASATVAMGSDWPVAPASPIFGIFAAVSRSTLDGLHPGGWVPEQKITLNQALLGYTRHAAYASHEENQKGSIEVGKFADFVIIKKVIWDNYWVIRQTWVGGKKVFQAPEFRTQQGPYF
jgi:predicted amidohydrolase YtcJ